MHCQDVSSFGNAPVKMCRLSAGGRVCVCVCVCVCVWPCVWPCVCLCTHISVYVCYTKKAI